MRALLAPVAAAAAFALSSASAVSAPVASASASFSNVVFRLVDLDPNDGITPWLNLDGFRVSADALSWAQGAAGPQTSSESEVFPLAGGSLGTSVVSGDNSAQTSVVRTGGVYDISASGSTTRGSRFSARTSIGSGLQTFELSPRTFLEIIGDASVAVQIEPTQVPGCPSASPACAHPDVGGSQASIGLEIRDAQDWSAYGSMNHLEVAVSTSDAVLQREASRRVGISATNGGTQAREFRLRMYMSLSGGNSVWTPPITPPVPEPSTYALLVAGLGVLAMARRHSLAKQRG